MSVDQDENVLDDQPPIQPPKEDTDNGSTKKYIFLDNFPASHNSIEEYITQKDGDTYIPLHSIIVLKKQRRMLYLPLEFGETTMDGLVDSGAFINAVF